MLRYMGRLRLGGAGVSTRVFAAALTLLAGLVLDQAQVEAQQRGEFACEAGRVCRDARSGMAARVLTRPAARLFADPDPAAAPIDTGLRAFGPWFVFAERGVAVDGAGRSTGWYQVGRRPGEPEGWLLAEDAFPWRSALVVAYAHPTVDAANRRSPVLMFESFETLHAMVSDSDPGAYSQRLLDAVEAGDDARYREAGLVSIEPRRFVDFRRGFYMLPVLDFSRLPLFDGEARLLKLAAAVPQTEEDSGRGSTSVADETYRRNALTEPTVEGTEAAQLTVEIKFVIDMTASMQPQIDAVGRAIAQLTDLLERDRLNARFRYGLVGYTDVAEQCATCPFILTHDFTPDGPNLADAVLTSLRGDPGARAGGGGDWPESAIEGVAAAVNGRWGENTLRFVILIGDASANPFGDPKNERLSIESVRSLADAAEVRIVALHAEHSPGADARRGQGFEAPPDPSSAAETAAPPRLDAEIARRQFEAMALNPGQTQASYLRIEIDPESPRQARQSFYDAVYGLAESLAEQLDKVRSGRLEQRAAHRAAEQEAARRSAAASAAGALALDAFDAALISYLGEPATRPRDLTFWALDVDPVDFATPSLEVRVLLEKRELETLILRLEALLEAFLRAKSVDSGGFFSQLQATSAATALDSDDDPSAAAQSLPKWLAALPYRSQVMGLTPRRFAEMSADERDRLEQSIQRKLYAYRDLFSSDEWISLWPGAEEYDQVFPLPLSDLP